MNTNIFSQDKEVYEIFKNELKRQQQNIILIPSENYASRATLEAAGFIFTNKYAEGYPAKRYYHGCKYVDEIENLAIERAKKLFNMPHCNVQAHSGSQANQAAFLALLQPQDKILAMSLDQGGHLSHGMKLNFSGIFYQSIFYHVHKETELIDFNEVRDLAKKEKPKMIIAGASAYSRFIDFKVFREIADEVGAYLLVDMAHIAGLIATKLHPDPSPYADILTSTTHKTLRGPRSGLILCKEEFAKKIDKALFPGLQGGPLVHIIAAKAVAFGEALKPEFVDYQKNVLKNAKALAQTFTEENLRVVSGGTDNHLMLLDLHSVNLSGQQAADLLESANIIVNKNVIPYDDKPPAHTSGIRPGSPVMTSRGFTETQAKFTAQKISQLLKNPQDENLKNKIKTEVKELCKKFPIYEYLNDVYKM